MDIVGPGPAEGSGLSANRSRKVIEELKAQANPENVEGMARYGIRPDEALGVPIPRLREIARKVGKDHELAVALWASGIHEARILASFVDDPKLVTERQMEGWVRDFDSWDVCDQCCSSLFDNTPFAHEKAVEWSGREEEFVKRAGFTLMAALAVHDKKSGDEAFLRFLPLIEREGADERNYVMKAVNWALRQIGKRNERLNIAAVEVAEEMQRSNAKSARWIASDALRELRSDAVRERIRKRERGAGEGKAGVRRDKED